MTNNDCSAEAGDARRVLESMREALRQANEDGNDRISFIPVNRVDQREVDWRTEPEGEAR